MDIDICLWLLPILIADSWEIELWTDCFTIHPWNHAIFSHFFSSSFSLFLSSAISISLRTCMSVEEIVYCVEIYLIRNFKCCFFLRHFFLCLSTFYWKKKSFSFSLNIFGFRWLSWLKLTIHIDIFHYFKKNRISFLNFYTDYKQRCTRFNFHNEKKKGWIILYYCFVYVLTFIYLPLETVFWSEKFWLTHFSCGRMQAQAKNLNEFRSNSSFIAATLTPKQYWCM